MNRKKTMILIGIMMCAVFNIQAAVTKNYSLASPDGKLKATIVVGDGIRYTFGHGGQQLIKPSAIAIETDNAKADKWKDVKVTSQKQRKVKELVKSPFYRVKEFNSEYNELELRLNNGFTIQLRAFNDGLAYRFLSDRKGDMIIMNEIAEFNFADDYTSYIPYSTNKKTPWCMAFQNFYTVDKISNFNTELPAFLPVTIDAGNRKVTILESDLESYPGMFVRGDGKNPVLMGEFAAYPDEIFIHERRAQQIVKTRKDYIAKVKGVRSFPWRVFAVTENDTQMPVNNLVYALASPERIGDCSWIKPGKVAWEWWNNWGIIGVDFKAGINTATYKYYIDFAAEYGLEYVVLDEGWSNPGEGNIMSVIPEIDLPELVRYANGKGVGLILWAVMNVLDDKLEEACRYYSGLGIKGFKVDFLDRDDQAAVDIVYRLAEMTAKYKLLIDYHGIYKPTGLNRTYPNAINFEGVFGLEELKWSNPDMPMYDVTLPFIRMMSGNIDYTQGAMMNANKKDFQKMYYRPMSQGTRCHQLATYIVFDSPLVMLCDAPTAYRKEPECTRFIAEIPVVAEETKILKGEMGGYIVTARQAGGEWFVGGLTNWDEREIELDFSFLGEGTYRAEIFTDGVNAANRGEDYKKEMKQITKSTMLRFAMAPGGGFALRLSPVK